MSVRGRLVVVGLHLETHVDIRIDLEQDDVLLLVDERVVVPVLCT